MFSHDHNRFSLRHGSKMLNVGHADSVRGDRLPKSTDNMYGTDLNNADNRWAISLLVIPVPAS